MSFEIIVNGLPRTVSAETVTFEDIFVSTFPQKITEMWNYTIVYRGGVLGSQTGILIPGDRVPVNDGMIFNIANCSTS